MTSFWVSFGKNDGTPKTDMYNKDYNISLKKKGGSQLASGGTGESIHISCCFRILRKTRW